MSEHAPKLKATANRLIENAGAARRAITGSAAGLTRLELCAFGLTPEYFTEPESAWPALAIAAPPAADRAYGSAAGDCRPFAGAAFAWRLVNGLWHSLHIRSNEDAAALEELRRLAARR